MKISWIVLYSNNHIFTMKSLNLINTVNMVTIVTTDSKVFCSELIKNEAQVVISNNRTSLLITTQIGLFGCLFVCLFVWVFVCLSICLVVWFCYSNRD